MADQDRPGAIPVETVTSSQPRQERNTLAWTFALLFLIAVVLLAVLWLRYDAAKNKLAAVRQAQITFSNQLATALGGELDLAKADAEALNYGLAKDRLEALRGQLGVLSALAAGDENAAQLDEAWQAFTQAIQALSSLDPQAPEKLNKLRTQSVSALRDLAMNLREQGGEQAEEVQSFEEPAPRPLERPGRPATTETGPAAPPAPAPAVTNPPVSAPTAPGAPPTAKPASPVVPKNQSGPGSAPAPGVAPAPGQPSVPATAPPSGAPKPPAPAPAGI